ncbi:MAG: LlaJI family restriction endonuclease [Eggerthellaceae bacterium]|nr:LlaJI family restriction endonuclease [Eggerthellaceae bacterium]
MLTTLGVLKLKNGSDSQELKTIYEEEGLRGKYQFVYVGLAICDELVLVVYPKYFRKRQPTFEQIRQVLRAIRKSSGGISQMAALTEEGLRQNDKVALMLALLEMYGEYGIYTNHQKEYEINGSGAISWDRTINFHHPHLKNGKPVYLEYETGKLTQDNSDYVTRLHKSVLTECSKFMEKSGLADLLALDPIELSDEPVEDFGEKPFIDYQLERESSVQFITWKQELLVMLRRYINDDEAFVESNNITCLGTSSFYHIWEEGCKIAFDDMAGRRLSKLPIKLPSGLREQRDEKLIEIIPSPKWYVYDGEGFRLSGESDTLIPDIVTLWGEGDSADTFAILDAKYYSPSLKGKPRNVPDLGSITKQYLYQSAYKELIKNCGFDHVVNAFLVPCEDEDMRLAGKVEFLDVFEQMPEPFTNDVKMWLVPVEKIWDCYLENKSMGMEEIRRLSE